MCPNRALCVGWRRFCKFCCTPTATAALVDCIHWVARELSGRTSRTRRTWRRTRRTWRTRKPWRRTRRSWQRTWTTWRQRARAASWSRLWPWLRRWADFASGGRSLRQRSVWGKCNPISLPPSSHAFLCSGRSQEPAETITTQISAAWTGTTGRRRPRRVWRVWRTWWAGQPCPIQHGPAADRPDRSEPSRRCPRAAVGRWAWRDAGLTGITGNVSAGKRRGRRRRRGRRHARSRRTRRRISARLQRTSTSPHAYNRTR